MGSTSAWAIRKERKKESKKERKKGGRGRNKFRSRNKDSVEFPYGGNAYGGAI